MTADHQKNVEVEKEDVLKMALQVYKSHLRDLVNKDL